MFDLKPELLELLFTLAVVELDVPNFVYFVDYVQILL